MRKVTITQVNDNGAVTRVSEMWIKADSVEHFIARKSRAYNMDRTTFDVS
jgi:hypothetical protein